MDSRTDIKLLAYPTRILRLSAAANVKARAGFHRQTERMVLSQSALTATGRGSVMPERPPKKWFRKTVRGIEAAARKKGRKKPRDPEAVAANIWHNLLSPEKRREILKREEGGANPDDGGRGFCAGLNSALKDII